MLIMSLGLGLPQFASASGAIALVGTLTYVMFFALGAGPVPGILVPEITPAKLRGEFSLSSGLSAAVGVLGQGCSWVTGCTRASCFGSYCEQQPLSTPS